ncbi:MAG: hypothetical protein ACFFB3_14595, partial [Candidatus Hodarchaeota archaeon]
GTYQNLRSCKEWSPRIVICVKIIEKNAKDGLINMSRTILNYKALYEQYSSENAHKKQFERYRTLDDLREALETFKEEHSCSEKHALAVMYLADFVVTSSNIRDLSITDEKRREAILQFCQIGLDYGLDADTIIYLHMLSQELGMAVRRNFVYQLDRGLPINVALIRLADTFVAPFLKFAKTVSDNLTLPWLIALIDGAISEILSSLAYEHLKEKDYLKDLKDFRIADAALGSLERFVKTRTEEPNPHAKVPTLSESAGAILIRNRSRNEEFFGYSKPLDDKQLAKLHKEFSEVCALSKFKKANIEPVYYRATSLAAAAKKLTRQVFLVRGSSPNRDYEAWFFLNATVDDINLEMIRRRLENRCLDIEGVLRRPLPVKKRVKKKIKKKADTPTTHKGEKLGETQKETKPSLWKRIVSLFRGKKDTSEAEEAPKITKAEIKTVDTVTEEEVEEKIEIEPQIDEWNRHEVLNYWAETLVIDAVAGIDLEEIYDTIREQNWIITGLADFPELPTPKGTLLAIGGQDTHLKSILEDLSVHFTELRDVAAQLLPVIAKDTQMRFIPQEVFLEHTIEDKLYDLFTFAATETEITVLIAQHSHLTNTVYIKPNKTIVKRRTLQQRTRQLATARTSFPIEDRMVSVLEPLIETSALKSQPISAQLVYDLRTDDKR